MDLSSSPSLSTRSQFGDLSPSVEPTRQPGEAIEPASTPERSAVVSLVTCDAVDVTPLAKAIEARNGRVESFTTPESWFDKQSRPFAGEEVADLVILVSHPATVLQQGWIARARAAAHDSMIVAALVDATLGQAAAVVNQGAQGLITGLDTPDTMTAQLSELIESATRKQDQRRDAARHRRSLASLTAAESDVLDLMLDGYANKQIAQRLSIGLRTVELRRSKIMRKMGASSVAQLISSVCAARFTA